MTALNKSEAKTQLETLISGLTLASETTDNLVLILKSAELASVDSSSIKTELLSRIAAVNNTTSIEELVLLSVALPMITENRSIFVADLTELNTLSVEPGTVVYVDSENLNYVYKTSTIWEPIFIDLQPLTFYNSFSWGLNNFGQLGNSTTTNQSSPVSVVGEYSDWIQVSAGASHSLGLRANGSIWSWGRNNYGQLGDGTSTNRSSPVSVVGGFTDWKQVSSSNHSLALRANGTAWAWGAGTHGRLGDYTTVSKSSPVSVVGGFTDWIQLSAGGRHSIGLRTNGTAWSWGANNNGQLGDNTTISKSSPVSVVGGFTDWSQVSAGSFHSIALRANGTAWAWGSNSGQLGDNSVVDKSSPVSVVGGFTDWVQVSGGGGHSLGLRANGTAWAWGYNGGGSRLGDNTTIGKSSPVSVVGGFADWVQVSASSYHSVAVRRNGTAWAWGNNTSGRLGDGTATDRSSPVSVVGGFADWVQVSGGVSHSSGIRCG